MDANQLQTVINAAWDDRENVGLQTRGEIREAVEQALAGLDDGSIRTAQPLGDHKWQVNEWAKKAVLLSFRLNDMDIVSGGPVDGSLGPSVWWDKVPSKFAGWGANRFREAGFRAVPNCVVRRSAFIAKDVVLMPSFVNLGAYVDAGTMVDTWAQSAPAPRLARTCICPAVLASVACWSLCRRPRSLSKTIASLVRVPRLSRG